MMKVNAGLIKSLQNQAQNIEEGGVTSVTPPLEIAI